MSKNLLKKCLYILFGFKKSKSLRVIATSKPLEAFWDSKGVQIEIEKIVLILGKKI